ncbi:MAG: hypothetical protein ACJAXF_000521 [Polaribacter sp.]|jgi:hypothetical protein
MLINSSVGVFKVIKKASISLISPVIWLPFSNIVMLSPILRG